MADNYGSQVLFVTISVCIQRLFVCQLVLTVQDSALGETLLLQLHHRQCFLKKLSILPFLACFRQACIAIAAPLKLLVEARGDSRERCSVPMTLLPFSAWLPRTKHTKMAVFASAVHLKEITLAWNKLKRPPSHLSWTISALQLVLVFGRCHLLSASQMNQGGSSLDQQFVGWGEDGQTVARFCPGVCPKLEATVGHDRKAIADWFKHIEKDLKKEFPT